MRFGQALPDGRVGWYVVFWIGIALAASSHARAQELVVDLSSHLIAISTAFTGTDVVLFGALDGPGDVVVIVRGPENEVVVRRMVPAAGIWVNAESMMFGDVPGFYGVASNRPIENFADDPVLERQGVGLDYLRLDPIDPGDATEAEIASFRDALIRDRQREGLYGADIGQVLFLGDRLFRTHVHFPANIPTGQYTVSALLFRDGQVAAAQTTPLIVSKIGPAAEIFAFAHNSAAAYGLIAIVIAIFSGWLAAVVFRRG